MKRFRSVHFALFAALALAWSMPAFAVYPGSCTNGRAVYIKTSASAPTSCSNSNCHANNPFNNVNDYHGFAMAGAFQSTGLAGWIGDGFTSFVTIRSVVLWVLLISFALTFLTEFTSNVATVNMFLPIVASISVSLGYDPRLLMLAATISLSTQLAAPWMTSAERDAAKKEFRRA